MKLFLFGLRLIYDPGELLAPFAAQLGGVCTLRSAVALMYKSVSGGR